MTIRSHIDLRQPNYDYGHFLLGVENAPDGMFLQAKKIAEMIGDMADDLIHQTRRNQLSICNADGIREIEVMVFELLRKKNPTSEIESCMGLGRTLDEYPESRDRVIGGLIRDRDCLQRIRDAQLVDDIEALLEGDR